VAGKYRMGIPELPQDPSPEQVAAWAELAALLRDPDFVASSRQPDQAPADVVDTWEWYGQALRAHA
jgi:hypothetical protein